MEMQLRSACACMMLEPFERLPVIGESEETAASAKLRSESISIKNFGSLVSVGSVRSRQSTASGSKKRSARSSSSSSRDSGKSGSPMARPLSRKLSLSFILGMNSADAAKPPPPLAAASAPDSPADAALAREAALVQGVVAALKARALTAVEEAWAACEPIQRQFIPHFVGPFLALATLADARVRRVACRLFVSMFERVAHAGRSFEPIEFEAVQQLQFLHGLDASLIPMVEEAFMQNAYLVRKKRARTLAHFLSLIFGAQICPASEAWELEKTLYYDELLHYCKKHDRSVMYLLFVSKLTQMHYLWKNYGEAAAAVMLYAGGLEFADRVLPPIIKHPEETEANRKIRLTMSAIALYEKAELWERAIHLIKTMKNGIERSRVDDLRELRRREEGLVHKIHHTQRFYAEHFRVEMWGADVPKIYLNKSLLWRGAPFERLANFTSTMKERFSSCVFVMDPTPPAEADRTKPGVFIQIVNVKTASVDEMDGREVVFDPRVPVPVQGYMRNNESTVFKFVKMFRPPGEAKSKDELSLWARVTFLQTSDLFPHHVRFVHVKRERAFELSPLENAVNLLQEKNVALEEIIMEVTRGEKDAVSQLTMTLNGMIDAAVNGGVVLYCQKFLVPSFAKANRSAETAASIADMQEALRKQLACIQDGLVLHERNISPELRGLHEKLEQLYPEMQRTLMPYIRDTKLVRTASSKRMVKAGKGKKKRILST